MITLLTFTALISVGYYFLTKTAEKKPQFDYVKKEPIKQEFTEAILAIQKKVPYKKKNYGPLAKREYRAFLDPQNPYHIMLSHKILKEQHTPWELTDQGPEDNTLREYEDRHSLNYANELARIIKSGDFEQFQEELDFLRQELLYFDPEHVDRAQQKASEEMNKNKDSKSLKVEANDEIKDAGDKEAEDL